MGSPPVGVDHTRSRPAELDDEEAMHGPIFAILALMLSAAATASVAQGTGQEPLGADPQDALCRACRVLAAPRRQQERRRRGHRAQERRGRLRGRPLAKRHPGDGRTAAAQRLYRATGGRQLTDTRLARLPPSVRSRSSSPQEKGPPDNLPGSTHALASPTTLTQQPPPTRSRDDNHGQADGVEKVAGYGYS